MQKTAEQIHLDELEDILNKEHQRLIKHLTRVEKLLAKVRDGQTVVLKSVEKPDELIMKINPKA